MKKTVYLFIIISLFNSTQGQIVHGSSGSFGHDTLQTSDILEIRNGRKFKAIINDKIAVHYIYKTSGDTSFYKIITGTLILFKHDSITRKDSIILNSQTIQTYYLKDKNEVPISLSPLQKSLTQIETIEFKSIYKIVIGRKKYKFHRTRENETVWSLGD
ncbi:MAG: hypothetical protein C0448_09105 [Sphingobacteriaceae bacterium]|nr:hypothetical protein [Sphingobacteriaceae bacterium]